MSKNYLLGFTILFLTACGGSSSGSSGSSSTGPINAAPVISSGNTYSVAENTTAIGSVAASDADGDALNYVLTGDDSSLVTLTGTTLSFNVAPDFEAPTDANSDNVYKVTLVVSDGLAKDAKDLEISVTNVNEGPQLIVGSSYTVSENTTTVTTASVSDSSSAVAFSLSGTDSAAMTIGESSGVLAFAANPDFEAPADADTDNVYNVTITATDDAGSNSADVTVTVTDVVECTGACDLFISEYAEGGSNNKYLEIANFTGAEVALSGYALPSVGNAPETVGEYEFWNGDIFGANDTIADGDVYVVCHGSSEQAILDRCDSTHNFLSNGDDGRKLVKGTEDSYTVVDVFGDFQGDPGSGWDICGVENGTQDHTVVKKEGKEGNTDWTSSRGTTADDCDWFVAEKDAFLLTEWDGLGSHCYDSSADAVTFTSSATFSVAENSTAVGTVAASVAGCISGETVTMALSGADEALFTIDAAGALAFAAAPDFEVTGSASGTNDYTVVVTATAGSKTAEQTITVSVTDVDETPPAGILAQFDGVFGGAQFDAATSTYTIAGGTEAWSGIANNNTALYPISLSGGGTITFTAAAPAGDVTVQFRFEKAPGGGDAGEPSYNTEVVTVTGTAEAKYVIDVPAQPADRTYSSLILYIGESQSPAYDTPVVVKDVYVDGIAAPTGVVPVFDGVFDGTDVTDDVYSFPSSAAGYAGFGNTNTDLNPLTFSEEGKLSFKGSAPDGDVSIYIKLERKPYNADGDGAASTEPSWTSAEVLISGADVKDYEIVIPAQGEKTFSSFLLYLVTRDIGVTLTDFSLIADEKVDTGNGGGILDMNEAFGGLVIGASTTAGSVTGPTYTWPTGAEVWAGVAHDPTKTDVYPMKFPNGGSVVAKMAAVTGDVVMRFKAEFASQSTIFWESPVRSVSSEGDTYTFTIPPTTDTYGNFLLYLNERDEALVVESVEVISND